MSHQSGNAITTGSDNTLVGSNCGITATTDGGLTGVGKGALQSSTGSYQTAMGVSA